MVLCAEKGWDCELQLSGFCTDGDMYQGGLGLSQLYVFGPGET